MKCINHTPLHQHHGLLSMIFPNQDHVFIFPVNAIPVKEIVYYQPIFIYTYQYGEEMIIVSLDISIILQHIGFRKFRGKWYSKLRLKRMYRELMVVSSVDAHNAVLEIGSLLSL